MSQPFRTKLHLLNHLNQVFDEEELQEFARSVSNHPLNEFEVKFRGESDSILRSLRTVPQAILEDVLENDSFEGHETDENENEEEDEDEEEDEEE